MVHRVAGGGVRTIDRGICGPGRIPPRAVLAGFLVAGLFFSAPVPAQESAAQGLGLDDLAFIAGAWKGELGGGVIEEHWSAPEGNNMMGMFRYVKDGQVTFYEMQTIEQEEGQLPILRIKHYHPGLRGWEEKDESVTFTLREVEGQRAVFDEDDSSTQLIYQLADGRFSIELVKNQAGKPTSQRFEFGPMP